MKKIIIAIAALMGLFSVTSCSDMLDTDSSRQIFDGNLDQKTDSVFFAFGIMQAMQGLADQYVFQGEMRGDNVALTYYTDNDLRQLYNFSATAANQYDSAYVYYRVINNCNYYIAHRDTTLLTGSTKVVMPEYAAVKAFRAWAYLQLARNYGKVPFFTEPLTKISQINSNNFPELDLQGIVDRLAPDLEQYSGYAVPDYGVTAYNIGSTNSGTAKTINPSRCFIPVDVILGEMYLETGQYDKAASHYTTYLTSVSKSREGSSYAQNLVPNLDNSSNLSKPSDYAGPMSGMKWMDIFTNNSTVDLVTYIPMAVNRLRGTTTGIPLVMGYNYYAVNRSDLYVDEIQLEPSTALKSLSDATPYYYYQEVPGALSQQYVGQWNIGDQRLGNITRRGTGEDSTKVWVTKYNNGNIILYRNTTIYLHLAEALNRLGHSDAAFAILKEGITSSLLDSTRTYITDATRTALTSTYPFLSSANLSKFPAQSSSNNTTNWGIHQHGSGVTGDGNYPGRSPYQLDTIVGQKLKDIASHFNVSVGTTKQDTINAVEDLLCDEYQLEFAFEGTRWYDLMRLARHKNQSSPYGSNFGSIWLARKLESHNPAKSLLDPENWYLPFK